MLFAAAIVSLLAFYGQIEAHKNYTDAQMPGTINEAAVSFLAGHVAYETLAEEALSPDHAYLVLARQATLKSLTLNENNPTAWNRLAYIDLVQNGRLTRDGLAAIYKSYEVSPFGRPQVMTWRVDFSTRVWPSLPDDLRAKALAQLPALNRLHTTWDWRVGICQTNPYREIYEPVCAATPGINRPGTSGS